MNTAVGDNSEEVLADLEVTARLAQGTERIRLVFTSQRIMAHLGKRGSFGVYRRSIASVKRSVAPGGLISNPSTSMKSCPLHDVAVASIETSSPTLTDPLDISVRVSNLRDSSETFILSILWNSTMIQTFQITLNAQASTLVAAS